MKPVENVSIGGYVFVLEEDACEACRNYLSELEAFYSKSVNGLEIMEGIEERMCELLLENRGEGNVVTLQMVESAISTLGRPEAIEEESGESQSTAETGRETRIKKKLYRDPSTGKLAGVCSGLGTFFGIDPTVLRLIFVILTLIPAGLFMNRGNLRIPDLSMPVVYMVLWICMPVARTVRQRDELRGESGTVDGISERVKNSIEEMGAVAGSVADTVAKSDSWKSILRIFALCIGVVMLVVGVAGISSMGFVSAKHGFLSKTYFLNRSLEELAMEAPGLYEMVSYPPFMVALVVSVVLPFIWFIYSGVMMMFDLKAPKWHPGLCIFVIWLIALTILASMGAISMIQGGF